MSDERVSDEVMNESVAQKHKQQTSKQKQTQEEANNNCHVLRSTPRGTIRTLPPCTTAQSTRSKLTEPT